MSDERSREHDPLIDAVNAALSQGPDDVAAWRHGQPGAWGRLAGRGILAYQRVLGRKLTQQERREVWAALWKRLVRDAADALRVGQGMEPCD